MALKHHEVFELLHTLHSDSNDLKELAVSMLNEYAANGNDSLAMIDYGATFNTTMRNLAGVFKALDDAGVFTMGQE